MNSNQTYLAKAHENILKYRLNSFKKISFHFNHGFQTTLEFPASVSDSVIV